MKSIINLYFYSSIHIALCAVALLLSSYHLLGEGLDLHYILFVASGTMLIYSLHRIVGIGKVQESRVENRFVLIRKYRKHLIVYTIIASAICAWSAWIFTASRIYSLLVPSILSLLYVLPVFIKKNRLRDINYIKIFLVAICWAWLCGAIPAMEMQVEGLELILFTGEKALFIFAITLPFDYRDIEVDKEHSVKTLGHVMGTYIKYAVLTSFVICILMVLANNLYSDFEKVSLLVTYLILEMIARYAMNRKHDYYYTGLVDGTMILFYLLVLLGSYIENYVG